MQSIQQWQNEQKIEQTEREKGAMSESSPILAKNTTIHGKNNVSLLIQEVVNQSNQHSHTSARTVFYQYCTYSHYLWYPQKTGTAMLLQSEEIFW